MVTGILKHGIDGGWIEGGSILLAIPIVLALTAGIDYLREKQFEKLNGMINIKKVNVIRGGETKSINT